MKWLYHATEKPKLFEDGENPAGWEDHPDKCKPKKAAPKKKVVRKKA